MYPIHLTLCSDIVRISVVALLNPHITDIHYAPMSADVHLFLTTLNAQKELMEYYVIVEKARLYQRPWNYHNILDSVPNSFNSVQ